MDAAVHRPAQTEGGELVSGVPHLDPKLPSGGYKPLVSPSNESCSVPLAEGYERWAPTYDQSPNPLLAREERYLLPLLSDLRERYVLDLACGTGRWLETLLLQGVRLAVGIDCSRAMLRVAGKKVAIAARLAQADCLSLPFQSSVFDLVICSFALSHVADLTSMVHELGRVTKPECDVFVSDLHPEAYSRGWRTGFRDGRSAVEIETLPRTAEEIIRAFYSGGFECVSHVPLCLGEPEKLIFDQAGKSHLFERACHFPAVLVCQFRPVLAEVESPENK